ncbi:DNA-3-methyladenine glycosylase I [Pontibacter sp. G13]|uniref:DNA-3-methyladenine glycosylase I n=1 Tax=Pontibacter sp. G13 TaxID=3074898 RepID=UPI00288A424A|nr:DNA-3-methyladenine glycosylase I [Pontibacter sp. G13]WNJ19709.1 DNA-3-methyladenine glycosylase I [Pontibacter sp. G13]
MAQYSSYCQAVADGSLSDLHVQYHDTEYGFPAQSDDALFQRMMLEINQAGLSWDLILRKRKTLRAAYADFQVEVVARFQEEDIERLLQDAGIIRMRRKIEAAIHNARQIQDIQGAHGSFAAWLDHHHPLPYPAWLKLFKKTFKFMGGETTKEFLMSAGYLPGAHTEDCPMYAKVLESSPRWYTHPLQ